MRAGGSLRRKLSLVLLVLFVLVGVGVVGAILLGARYFGDEVNHELNSGRAAYLAAQLEPFAEDGSVDKDALAGVFMQVMTVNPTLELYLIDRAGQVLAYDAPPEAMQRMQVDVTAAERFVAAGGSELVRGDDPRSASATKPISAAPVLWDGEPMGYLYIVLGGQQFDGVFDALRGSYVLLLGIGVVVVALLLAALAGFGVFGSLTRPLERLRTAMQNVHDDGPAIELEVETEDEIGALTEAFNRMSARIARQVELLKVTDDERRRFVANISHDLRTPTATVQGYLETLLIKSEGLAPAERERFLEIALAQTKRLGSLIDDLFDLARLEARDVEPVHEPFDLAELASDVVAKLQVLAEAEGRRLVLEVEPPGPFEVRGDVGLFERVFDNLIHNALRATPAGTAVVVSVGPGPDRATVEARVRDQGPGIPAAERERIFERFYRGESRTEPAPAGPEGEAASLMGRSVRQMVRGTGLGLAIVARVVELHGGSVVVEDLPSGERGASLRVSVPRAAK